MVGVFNHQVQTETANFVHNADKPLGSELKRILPVANSWTQLVCTQRCSVARIKAGRFQFLGFYCHLHL